MSLCEPADPEDVAGRLNFACQTGSVELVKRVVADCNVKNFDLLDQYGSPPLYNAALKHDSPELVRYLVGGGAGVEVKNSDNETPFFIAAFNNHLETAKILLENGAKTDQKGGVYGDYPIHTAVKNNHSGMLNLLISKKAAINCRNDHNETPLFLACKLDRFGLAYTLLMNKANKGLASEGKDCLYIASEKKNKDIVRLLKSAGPAEMMEVKHSVQKTKKRVEKKVETWQQTEFKKELDMLGISEAEAVRKPRDLPKPAPHHKSTSSTNKPLPLYNSDEEEELNNITAPVPAPSLPPPPRTSTYQDPAGTTYNPTGAAHLKDIEHAKAAFRDFHAPHPAKAPPPPGFIDHPFTEAEVKSSSAPSSEHSPSPPRRGKAGGQGRRAVAAASTGKKR